MINKEAYTPSPLLGQTTERKTHDLVYRSSPGKPTFMLAHTEGLLNKVPSFESQDEALTVAYCFDGSFLPVRNGCSYTLLNLMKAVAGSGHVRPLLVLCDRGSDSTNEYVNQPFSTLFVHPDDYYTENGVLEDALHERNVRISQFYSSEGVLNLGPRFRRAKLSTVFEIQNTDYALLEQLGASRREINEAKRKQIAAQRITDLIFARSASDHEAAIELGADSGTIYEYQGAINPDEIDFLPDRKSSKNLIFLGHLHYAPNQRAVNQIIELILPELESDYHLTAIGVGPEKLVRRYEAAGVEVRDTDDLNRELAQHYIALAPLTEGSGTRLKLLDYLASGIMTISTSKGIEGLDTRIKDCLMVEDDLRAYAPLIRNMISNPELYQERVHKGRHLVEQRYSWSNAVIPFLKAYERLTRERL